MSRRDKELLEISRLSATTVGRLLGCSRQAVYQGVARSKDYFSISNLSILILHLKRSDSDRLFAVMDFIAEHYLRNKRESEIELVTSADAGLGQLSRVAARAHQIIIWMNENIEHLENGHNLWIAIERLLNRRPVIIDCLLPEIDTVLNKLREIWPEYHLSNSHIFSSSAAVNLPTVIAVAPTFVRAFVFARLSVEEIEPTDARRVWELASTTVPRRVDVRFRDDDPK
ncbi:MAG TPA: hypothetical protein VKP67_20550 [Xanthobacteraceae bacterium]|nr:hypothetical protein [Xanthobacteraceae bacterium]